MGVPIIRTTVYWGLYWGPLILGNYQVFMWALYDAYEEVYGLIFFAT